VLRNELELSGPKYGCGLAQCGACTVIMDERRSILHDHRSEAQNRSITTLEGIGTIDHPSPFKSIPRRAGGAMRILQQRDDPDAKALLDKNPNRPKRN